MKNKVSIKELKDFALAMSLAIPFIFMLLLPWIFEGEINFWPLYISAILILLYFFFPKGIHPIFRFWMVIASIIGWINTRVILAFVFYVVMLPIGILLKIFDKLQYKHSEDDNESSFYKKRDPSVETDLKRPF